MPKNLWTPTRLAGLLAGLALILIATAMTGYNLYARHRAASRSARVLHELQAYVAPYDTADPISPLSLPPEPRDASHAARVSLDDYDYLGILTIPTLSLTLPVTTTYSDLSLLDFPARYYGAADTNDLVIMAHNYPNHFGHLSQLRLGHEITFTPVGQSGIKYQVVAIDTIPDTDVATVTAGQYDLLLFTCTYDGADRFVISANRRH